VTKTSTEETPDAKATSKECTLKIGNERGLHARASAKFVKCAEQFKADILVSKDGVEVSGVSIMGLLMLGASIGTSIDVSASGAEAAEALDALRELVEAKFYEDQPD
jgi:phosphocarrier protein HPr